MSLYFCSGLKRSASTWSYNVCQFLLAYAYGYKNITAGYVGEGHRVEDFINQNAQVYPNMLIKFHFPTPAVVEMVAQGKAKNVYTVRDPLTALASEMDFFKYPFPVALGNIEAGLKAMDTWKKAPGTLFIDFVNITSRPKQEIERIAAHLELDVDDEFVSECTKETSYVVMKQRAENLKYIPKDKLRHNKKMTYDPATLLHIGHAPQGQSRDWRTILKDKELQAAIERLKPWLPEEIHSKHQINN